jgi:hypothetical protein
MDRSTAVSIQPPAKSATSGWSRTATSVAAGTGDAWRRWRASRPFFAAWVPTPSTTPGTRWPSPGWSATNRFDACSPKLAGTWDRFVGHVVLAPELLNAGDVLVDELRHELRSRVLPATADLIEIEVTQLGGDLVLAGAASAVLADRLGVVLR